MKLTEKEKEILIKLISNEQIKHLVIKNQYDTDEYALLEQLKVKIKVM